MPSPQIVSLSCVSPFVTYIRIAAVQCALRLDLSIHMSHSAWPPIRSKSVSALPNGRCIPEVTRSPVERPQSDDRPWHNVAKTCADFCNQIALIDGNGRPKFVRGGLDPRIESEPQRVWPTISPLRLCFGMVGR
jgi:hypothetical protein